MLYGATFEVAQAEAARLQPVMTLQSRVISVRELPAGEPVGYGAKFVSPRPTRVGVVAMGYADGYPRQAPNGTPVLVAGKRTQLIGRVSMDMLCIDLTDVPQATSAARSSWGKQVLASEVAAQAAPFRTRSSATKRVPRTTSANETLKDRLGV
jgi:alanine racemase